MASPQNVILVHACVPAHPRAASPLSTRVDPAFSASRTFVSFAAIFLLASSSQVNDEGVDGMSLVNGADNNSLSRASCENTKSEDEIWSQRSRKRTHV
jgi:hypothetical protein